MGISKLIAHNSLSVHMLCGRGVTLALERSLSHTETHMHAMHTYRTYTPTHKYTSKHSQTFIHTIPIYTQICLHIHIGFPGGSDKKDTPAMRETKV